MKVALDDCILTGVQSRADRSVKISLVTQELGEDAGVLMNMAGNALNVLLVGADVTVRPEDVPDAPAGEEYGEMTPARLQRAILYRIWEARDKPMATFEAYYRHRMSKNEQLLKDELDTLTT
jgi:hypothetical protein